MFNNEYYSPLRSFYAMLMISYSLSAKLQNWGGGELIQTLFQDGLNLHKHKQICQILTK